jgi:hypothetical protein
MSAPRASSDRRGWAIVAGAFVASALVLTFWGSVRSIDGDEGFYLTAGRYVVEGRHLYADVFYPQMPYLPWLEAVVFRVFGVSLAAGRALSIVTGSLAAAVVTWLVWRVEQSHRAALLAAILYVAHGPSLHMLCLAKTYGLTDLLLLVAFAPFALGRIPRAPWAFVAGAAVAGAIGVRLPSAAVALVLAVLAARAGLRPFLAFVCGGLVGSLGWLIAGASDLDHFWFCNVTFHSLRREVSGMGPIAMQKAGVIAKWLFLPQNVILWVLVLVALWKGPRRWAAACCALALALALAAATPTYLQYMVHFFPFALLAAGPALVILSGRRALTAVVLALYIAGIYPAVRAVPAENELAGKRELWDRRTVSDVTEFIRAHTGADDVVLSWWEGYPVLSGRPGVVGVGFWESNVAKKLHPDAARHYHVMRQEEIDTLIGARVPRVIVTTTDNWRQHKAQIDAGYDLAHQTSTIEVYLRRETPPSAAAVSAAAFVLAFDADIAFI